MTNNITDADLEKIWTNVVDQKNVPPTLDNKYDPDAIDSITYIFKRCYQARFALPIELSSFSDELRLRMKTLVEKSNLKPVGPIYWSVDIVAGSTYIQESLQVLITIEIGGQKYQFDLEQFSKLRKKLSDTMITFGENDQYH